MIKKWHQFIKESVEWQPTKEILDMFIGLTDEDYIVSVDKGVFYDGDGKKIWVDPKGTDGIITLGVPYNLGYKIDILKSGYKGGDVTIEFQSALSALKSEGYMVEGIYDDDDRISPDYLVFKNGAIVTWIPEIKGKPLTDKEEDWSDGDVFVSSYKCELYVYQPEKIDISSKDLAEIYQWKFYTTKGEQIYFDIDIDDLANIILDGNSPYLNTLVNGFEADIYDSRDYKPDIHDLFRYKLNKENSILVVKSLIKEIGGLENLIEESDNENLKGKSESEVISILLSEKVSYRDDYYTLIGLCEDSDIVNEVRQLVGDWEMQAASDRNEEEMYEAFDELLRRSGIEFQKIWKEGKRFFYKKNPSGNKEKVWYDDMIWWYTIQFDDIWIKDTNYQMFGNDLSAVFQEWASYYAGPYPSKNILDPNFSNYGDVDAVEMNSDIEDLLKRFIDS